MDPELEAFLQDIRAALDRGDLTEEQVNKRLAESTQFKDLDMLERFTQAQQGNLPTEFANRMALEAVEDAPSPAQRRMSAGGSATGDFGALALNQLLFNFGDEILGEGFGQRVSDVEAEAPLSARLAAGAAGAAPQALLPLGAALRGAGISGRVAVPAAIGGAEGAVAGLGAAEGSLGERITSLEPGMGAVVGLATGGLTGGLGGLGQTGAQAVRRGTRAVTQGPTGRRLAQLVTRMGGDMDPPSNRLSGLARKVTGGRLNNVPDADVRFEALQNQTRQVADDVFGPLDQIEPPRNLLKEVNRLRQHPVFGAVAEKAIDQTEDMNLRQMQRVHNALLKAQNTASDATDQSLLGKTAREFGEQIEDAYPGYANAQQQFAMAKEVEEGFAMGYLGSRASGQSELDEIAGLSGADLLRPAKIRQAMKTFSNNPEAQDAVRAGIRQRMKADFLTNEQSVSDLASNLAKMERGTRREVLREVFPSETAAKGFLRGMKGVLDQSQLTEGAGRSIMFRSLPSLRW